MRRDRTDAEDCFLAIVQNQNRYAHTLLSLATEIGEGNRLLSVLNGGKIAAERVACTAHRV